MTTALHQLPAIVLAFITLAALLAIGVLIWQALPRRSARERDIERQIATLRQGADHAVRHRPRVRANGCAATPGHLKAVPKAEKPKACGGGQCRHRADCADTYCPGRLSASLTGTKARHARH